MPNQEIEEGGWVVMDPVMRRIRDLARRVALTDVPLLITGESGTGKDVLARFVHRGSPRREEPFVALNCAAIPTELVESELFGFEKGAFSGASQTKPGAFELADRGTLFLDEIGEMPLGIQSKLLRAVEHMTIRRLGGRQELRVDTRIVAATNQPIHEQIRDRTFREDLYYRLSVSEIHLPPLRERPADIPLLCAFFMRHLNEKYRVGARLLSDEALDALRRHEWPGNIRQLRNVLERACLMSDADVLTLQDLPMEIAGELGPAPGRHVRPDVSGWHRWNADDAPSAPHGPDSNGWSAPGAGTRPDGHAGPHQGGNGKGSTQGNGNGHSSWNGHGNGHWSGKGSTHGSGNGYGHGNGHSRGNESSQDTSHGRENGQAKRHAQGTRPDHGNGSVTIPVGTTLRHAELLLIRTTLQSVDNNKTHAAKILGCSRKTLHNKLNARSGEE